MKRRNLLENLAQLVGAGTVTALLPAAAAPAPAEGTRSPGQQKLPAMEGERVHYVSSDRRHIEAVLVHRYRNDQADLLMEIRPSVHGALFLEARQRVPMMENTPERWNRGPTGLQTGTWHPAEKDAPERKAKPYSEWWLKRREEVIKPARFGMTHDENFDSYPEIIRITRDEDGVIVNSLRPDPDDTAA